MYKILIILFSILLPKNLFADMPKLTKEQQIEDFDFMYDKILNVFPYMEIYKHVTGRDILANIAELRNELKENTSQEEFFDIFNRALYSCQDGHTGSCGIYPYNDVDTIYKNNAIEISEEYVNKYFGYFYYKTIPVIYNKGDYYLTPVYENGIEKIIQIPPKSKLLKINGVPIDEYIEKLSVPLHYDLRWDFNLKKYYSWVIFSPNTLGLSEKFLVTYSNNGKIFETDISISNIERGLYKGKYTPRVLYFSKDSILYIRIPEMDTEKIDFYKKEILEHRGQEIKKVVIDVRGNEGGNDKVWEKLLSFIIDKPINALQKLCFKNTNIVRQYLKKSEIEYISETPLIINNDTFFCIKDTRNISPDDSSLLYNGKIYLLVDKDCYSSTTALSTLSLNIGKIITVGTTTDRIVGEGIRPFYFILPNSKLIFDMACSLDGNVKTNNVEEFYHNKVNIPIEINLDYYYKELDYTDEFYNEYFLYNIDPVFLKVLNL